MSHDALTWVAAVVQVVTAGVFALYWLTWFREAHDEPWLPNGYVEHERVFVYSDSLVASLLVVSVLAVFEVSWGRTLALVCAGMLLFLGVIDAASFAQHRMFARTAAASSTGSGGRRAGGVGVPRHRLPLRTGEGARWGVRVVRRQARDHHWWVQRDRSGAGPPPRHRQRRGVRPRARRR